MAVPPAATGASGDVQMFSVMAAKEGLLVLGLNLAVMPSIMVIHTLLGACIKLERDRDIMKRQAEQQAVFAKSLISESSGKPAPETKMPEKEEATKEDEGVSKRK